LAEWLPAVLHSLIGSYNAILSLYHVSTNFDGFWPAFQTLKEISTKINNKNSS
jgi:hypothetical protein